jgi:hypothetical protein
MGVWLDESSERNDAMIRFVRGRLGDRPAFALPDAAGDPYYEQGSHPDVVERLWGEIGAALPTDCRCLVHGTPALVHPTSGIVLAFSMGTGYFVRLPSGSVESASSFPPAREGWDVEAVTTLGADWVVGRWAAEEVAWCRSVFDQLASGSA